MEDELQGRLLRGGMAGMLMLLIFLLVNSMASLLTHAFQTEEISNWDPIVTNDYTVDWKANRSEIKAVFSYEYGGRLYEVRGFSPFGELNKAAGENPELIQRLLSKDHLPITVYVNPENPEIASMASGWSRSGYANDLSGLILFTLALIGLYFCLQPKLRVRNLIPG